MTGTQTVTLTDFLLTQIKRDRAAARYERPLKLGTKRWAGECDAKWQIVTMHSTQAPAFCDICSRLNRDMDGFEEERPYPCATLRALALPYADHPDYREEWKP